MDALFGLPVIHRDGSGPLPLTLGPLPGTSWAPPEAVVILKVMNWGRVQGME